MNNDFNDYKEDDMDFEESLCEEDNPFDNPDMTFSCEENAYNAGYELAFDEDGCTTDLDDIDFPSCTEKEVIKAFKRGCKYGGIDRFEMEFGEEGYEPKYRNFQPHDPDEYGNEDCDDDDEDDDVYDDE